MHLKIQGLVLRVVPYKDNDAILSILTADRGVLSAKARGIRRKNSPLIAGCQLLAYTEFVLFEHRDFYTINEAHTIHLFPQLRRDISKLSLATYFAQAADLISQEDAYNPQLLPLVLNCLYALCNLDIPQAQIKAVFELRLACIAGYTPDLQGCMRCGNPAPNRFDISMGHLECDTCRDSQSNGIRMPVTPGTLDAMRYIVFCEPRRLFAFQAGQDTLEQLSQISESYLSSQLERGFSALDYYKTVSAQ